MCLPSQQLSVDEALDGVFRVNWSNDKMINKKGNR